ncbi:hypothetical protein Bbelb_429080 [Branchiostoma belcheri]|nr:hypothetical protein Bbelb_429080 [Branchiostoma belcheri]
MASFTHLNRDGGRHRLPRDKIHWVSLPGNWSKALLTARHCDSQAAAIFVTFDLTGGPSIIKGEGYGLTNTDGTFKTSLKNMAKQQLLDDAEPDELHRLWRDYVGIRPRYAGRGAPASSVSRPNAGVVPPEAVKLVLERTHYLTITAV